jgi:uncharacterized glyoxalase superfamily protein PhnB
VTERITPQHQPVAAYLFYENVAAALDWLAAAFGLRERYRVTAPNGAIAHAEMELGGGLVMIGNVGVRNASRPATVRSSVYAYVPDVAAHCARARAAGAAIVEEPAERPFGDRLYLARDLEGHEWYFAQRLREVAVEDVERLLHGRRPGGV